MTIGDRIRARREELGMSQSDLARKAGYKSRSSINKIENDDRGATRENLISIAKALRVTPSYLMGWEDEDSSSLSALQEELMEKIFELSLDNQQTLIGIVETLLKAQTRKDENDD